MEITQFWPEPTTADHIKANLGWWVDYWAFRGWWMVKPDFFHALDRERQLANVMDPGCNWTPAWYFPTREAAEEALAVYMLKQGD